MAATEPLVLDLPAQLLAVWPKEIREHVSPSFVTQGWRCPEQQRRRYVLGMKDAPGASLVLGRAHHGALEHNYKQKVDTGIDLSIADIEQRFAHLLDKEIDGEGGESQIDWRDGHGKEEKKFTRASILDVGVKLSRAYREDVSPRVQPIAVERSFTRPVAGFPVPLHGYIDLEAAVLDPLKEQPKAKASDTCLTCDRDISLAGAYVHDRGLCSLCAGDVTIEHKTTTKTQVSGDWRFQMALYQLETGLPGQWHLSLRQKMPRVVETEWQMVPPQARTLYQVAGAMRLFAFNLATYGPYEPWPSSAPGHPWACSWCAWRPECAHWTTDRWQDGLLG